jgi:hypothetical protein
MADAIIPAWVAPTDAEFEDAHRIAHAVAADGGGYRWQARAAALDWVTGLQDAAPVTGRIDLERLGAQVVLAEMLVADCVVVGGSMADEMWRKLDVDRADPITNVREWADAVAAVLGWLLGTRSAPIRTPRRNRDGTVMTAPQLYREKAAARRILEPEDRARLRTQAEVEADVYRRLASLADSSCGRPLTRA